MKKVTLMLIDFPQYYHQYQAIPIRHVELIWSCFTFEHAKQKKPTTNKDS